MIDPHTYTPHELDQILNSVMPRSPGSQSTAAQRNGPGERHPRR
jgi:hypothetical protein